MCLKTINCILEDEHKGRCWIDWEIEEEQWCNSPKYELSDKSEEPKQSWEEEFDNKYPHIVGVYETDFDNDKVKGLELALEILKPYIKDLFGLLIKDNYIRKDEEKPWKWEEPIEKLRTVETETTMDIATLKKTYGLISKDENKAEALRYFTNLKKEAEIAGEPVFLHEMINQIDLLKKL